MRFVLFFPKHSNLVVFGQAAANTPADEELRVRTTGGSEAADEALAPDLKVEEPIEVLMCT